MCTRDLGDLVQLRLYPLHSLLNKRVYLIESAAKNRYVPPLVDDVANVRAVACVPLYDGSTPDSWARAAPLAASAPPDQHA